jgi:hypothetical protein
MAFRKDTMKDKVGYGFLVVPLSVLGALVLLAILSAGGLNQFADGLGLVKDPKK